MMSVAEVSTRGSCLAQVCFALASLSAVLGIALGMYMGINDDHTLTPVHAHTNLICWVSLFLFGVYYHLQPHVVGWLAKLQVAFVAVGAVMAFGNLAIMLSSGDRTLIVITIVGSVMVFVGFLMFCFIVCRAAFSTHNCE
jgi:uncharacterized membrane protein YgdD (TMEM256/DUF423 family)